MNKHRATELGALVFAILLFSPLAARAALEPAVDVALREPGISGPGAGQFVREALARHRAAAPSSSKLVKNDPPAMTIDECKTQLTKAREEIESTKKAEQSCQAKLGEAAKPAGEKENSAAAGVSGALLPFASPSSMPVSDVLRLLLLSGLMGMLGQGARTIVGLKKLSDLSNTAPSRADEFTAARIFIGLMIGFIAGVIGGLTPKAWDAHAIGGDIIFYLASIGYIGVDGVQRIHARRGQPRRFWMGAMDWTQAQTVRGILRGA
jgi:hypothetical protein